MMHQRENKALDNGWRFIVFSYKYGKIIGEKLEGIVQP